MPVMTQRKQPAKKRKSRQAARPPRRQIGWVVTDGEDCVVERSLFDSKRAAEDGMKEAHTPEVWKQMKKDGHQIQKGGLSLVSQKMAFAKGGKRKKELPYKPRRQLGWVIINPEGCVARRFLFDTRKEANDFMNEIETPEAWKKMKREGWKTQKGGLALISQKTSMVGIGKRKKR